MSDPYSVCISVDETGGTNYDVSRLNVVWHVLSGCPPEFVSGVLEISKETIEHKRSGTQLRFVSVSISRNPVYDEVNVGAFVQRHVRYVEKEIRAELVHLGGPVDFHDIMNSDLFNDFIIRG